MDGKSMWATLIVNQGGKSMETNPVSSLDPPRISHQHLEYQFKTSEYLKLK